MTRCDVCHAEMQTPDSFAGANGCARPELTREYVLIKDDSDYKQATSYTWWITTEMARVSVSMCLSCYNLKMEATSPRARSGDFPVTREGVEEMIFFPFAREKLSEVYPKETATVPGYDRERNTARRGPPFYPRYDIRPAREWDAWPPSAKRGGQARNR